MTSLEENVGPIVHDRVYSDQAKVRVVTDGETKIGKVIAFAKWRNEYQVSFETGFNGTDNPYSQWFHADKLTATE